MSSSSSSSSKKKKVIGGGNAKYFQTTKKGETAELKQELNSLDKDVVKEAVKKVIAAMTVGKDVSMLFTDVVKSIQTPDLELKKLVYLYVINYARSQPDKAVLVVNTFQKDATDSNNPLVRALAIRTIGCIRVDRITEYLCEPLKKGLEDKNPYVRKTAAICTAKLYDINPELVEEQEFIEKLRDLISDANPMVVANAVAALTEISETSKKDVFHINSSMLEKLLLALNECTEWGQVFILDALAKYEPNAREAEKIIERVTPRLQHANSAVVMSAVKVILKYINAIKDNPGLERQIYQSKLPPPLITLLSDPKPEVQYVALRNINLIIQKREDVLNREVKHFFCKYNDPLYVKLEKLEIMVKLTNADNIDQVLLELKEYAAEVDVDFVRKSVRAIGRCAIKLDRAAERCVKALLELIQTKVNHVVQEAVVVIKDIFRKYPNRYESIIATLCENLDTLDEPEAKASMVWIIGEYAARIENAPELLDGFVRSFSDEPPAVQLQLLTATVKLFLRRPDESKEMVTKVLDLATESTDNPDLRDRGYVYWRLLSTDPEAAQTVVLSDKPTITDDISQLDPSILEQLIGQISTLASVYHKPPEVFIKGAKAVVFRNAGSQRKRTDSDDEQEEEEEEQQAPEEDEEESKDEESKRKEDAESDDDEPRSKRNSSPPPKAKPASNNNSNNNNSSSNKSSIDVLGDLMSELGVTSNNSNNNKPAASNSSFGDFDFSTPSTKSENNNAPTKISLPANNAKVPGFQVRSAVVRRNGLVYIDMLFENQLQTHLNNFAIKINRNFFSLDPVSAHIKVVGGVAPGGSAYASVPLTQQQQQGALDDKLKAGLLQIALKTDAGVAFFSENVPTHLLFQEDGNMDKKEFLDYWKSVGDESEQKLDLAGVDRDADRINQRLSSHRVFMVAKRSVPNKGDVLYLSLKINNVNVLVEITVGQDVKACARSNTPLLSKTVLQSVLSLLRD